MTPRWRSPLGATLVGGAAGAGLATLLGWGAHTWVIHHESAATGATAATVDEASSVRYGVALGLLVGGLAAAILVRGFQPRVGAFAVGVAALVLGIGALVLSSWFDRAAAILLLGLTVFVAALAVGLASVPVALRQALRR